MTDHLNIAGRLIAHTRLERSLSSYQPVDELFLFQDDDAGAWTVLTLVRVVDHNEDGVITRAQAQVFTSTYASVAEVAKAISDRYYSSGWTTVLDNLDFNDGAHPELYLRWATHRMERDLHQAPMYVKDLALATTFFATENDLLPGVGRALDGWEEHHLALMATQLTDAGFEVLAENPDVEPGDNPAKDPVLGLLTVRRYGHQATLVVRVDDVGEVFARLRYPDDDDDGAPALTVIPDEEDDW